VAVSFFVITTLHIVLGEQAPKVMAIRSPERTALLIAPPLAWFNAIFSPLIRFLDWATNMVLWLLGVADPAGGHTKVHTAAELRMLVEESGEAGALDEGEQEMLLNVFTFADRPAYQAMIPRTEVLTIDHDASLRDFLTLFASSGHTRYPVVGPGGVDDVQGLVSAKDLLLQMRDGAPADDQPLTPLVRPVFFTPESKRVGDLLQEMRISNTRLAVLIDEYGGFAGIVTLEDLIEEIIGDLSDDYAPDTQELQTIDEHTTVVEGQVRIEDLNDELGLELPAGEYETLAGFILDQLGRLPQPGDSLVFEGTHLSVIEMQGPRIRRVRVITS
jgi:CBS domain containing-hemolysin-like protein